jgi:hypothetical protein
MGALGAGTSLVRGKMDSSAAKKAAQIQSDAAKRVEPIYGGIYQQQMRGMDPYASMGRSSANTLGRLMQPGAAYSPQMQAQDARAQQNAPPQWSPNPGAAPSMAGSRPMGGAPQMGTAMPGPGAPQGQTVRLRGPDGSMRDVPEAQAAGLLARGATRVQ